jgi:ethylbenzene dioxygenase ferredoxin component
MSMPTKPKEDNLVALCAADSVQPGAPIGVILDQVAYAIFNLSGQFYVTQNRCTHGPGILSRGSVIGDEIECPFHRGRFHIPTGRATGAPCTEALKVWTVHVIGGTIYIDPAQAQRAIPVISDRPQ